MTAPAVLAVPWAARRARADVLRERYPFAREPLALYRALVDVQESAWSAARLDPPRGADVAGYVADRVLPGVIDVSAAAGPKTLADLLRAQFAGASIPARGEMIRRWLDGEERAPVERYLARASAGPVLEALGERAGDACGSGGRPGGDEVRCPVCGGLPQLAYIAAPPDSLAAGPRSLLCSRCASSWAYPRLTCASCGEQDTAKLTVLAEEGTDERTLSGSTVRGLRGRPDPGARGAEPRFPHMRIDACAACSRYLVSIDLGRDPRAVPVVDELAAIPLDLHAVDRGFTKVVPNLMGA
ncbi:MAG TPA: formate dehydrogenase accessory protein FdhE [bacterium]|nr:formate dehydrogenase accessory protein FdhE [bacterium]